MSELDLNRGAWKFYRIDPGVLSPQGFEEIPMDLINKKPRSQEMTGGVKNTKKVSNGIQFEIEAFSEKTIETLDKDGQRVSETIPLVHEGTAYLSNKGYAVFQGDSKVKEVFDSALGLIFCDAREIEVTQKKMSDIVDCWTTVSEVKFDEIPHPSISKAALNGTFNKLETMGEFDRYKNNVIAVKGKTVIPAISVVRGIAVTRKGVVSIALKASDILDGGLNEELTDWIFEIIGEEND